MITDLISNSSSYSVSQVAAQSRATRVATRVVRIVKLFRIIRVMKLYKSAVKADEIKSKSQKEKLLETKNKLKNHKK